MFLNIWDSVHSQDALWMKMNVKKIVSGQYQPEKEVSQ